MVKAIFLCASLLVTDHLVAQSKLTSQKIQPLTLREVKVNDPFWSARYKVWTSTTTYDVFNKLEGNYEPDRQDIIDEKKKLGRTSNAFLNFDEVAKGKKGTGIHDGPPWYDGLVYESIRGAADLLISYPDAKLETKIDRYIERIGAAQAADSSGYLNTYTTLMRPTMPWGTNGGDDNWQHDCYNAGMMVEAGIHYYQATGKTKLLEAATRFANLMARTMGDNPRKNIIPGHGGPEEALLKLYWLYKNDPTIAQKINVPVQKEEYYRLATYWIEHRGDHGETTGNTRPNFEAYDQDDKSVFEQKSIEGHAVRATLLATGIAATAMENGAANYTNISNLYWNNMIGKKMFITGGEGAIPDQEKFGPDYFLPESAYLETCAAISAAFFSARMNEFMGNAKYMDAFERVLYNNMLSGVSLAGDHYFYENPLKAKDHKRWEWHGCPCCPPMILKMVGMLPTYIYGTDAANLFVNLFIGSEASAKIDGQTVKLKQQTDYPWKGKVIIDISPETESSFTIHIRIPGWAEGKENPFDLYSSKIKGKVALSLNGKSYPMKIENGYAMINRIWKRDDRIELLLPVEPRLVAANESVNEVKNKLAIAAGPVVYGLEAIDNPKLDQLHINQTAAMNMQYKTNVLTGVNIISGQGFTTDGQKINFTAIPFFSFGNRSPGSPYQVWIPK